MSQLKRLTTSEFSFYLYWFQNVIVEKRCLWTCLFMAVQMTLSAGMSDFGSRDEISRILSFKKHVKTPTRSEKSAKLCKLQSLPEP
jgi:hypothetical protein